MIFIIAILIEKQRERGEIMEYRHRISLAFAAILVFSSGHALKPQPKCTVHIDRSAALRFGKDEATMHYAYKVVPPAGGLECSKSGEGTLNFKNALGNNCSSLSAFSHVHEKNMADITIHTSTIKVGDKTYTPSRKTIHIRAHGYPYVITYDAAQDQFHIIDKDKASITQFICPQQESSQSAD